MKWIRRGSTSVLCSDLFTGDLWTAQSVAQTRGRKMGLLANTRLEMMCKELSVVQCEAISIVAFSCRQ